MAKADVTTLEFGACVKKSGGVNSEMMDCVDVETKRKHDQLNQPYQKFIASLQPARKAQLVDAQRAWLKYRELTALLMMTLAAGRQLGLLLMIVL